MNYQSINETQTEEIDLNNLKNGKQKSLTRLWSAIITCGILFVGYLIMMLVDRAEGVTVLSIIISALFVASFVFNLFFEDSWVRELIINMSTKTISFPGLIWEFSFDGFLWLIGMKLLFFVVGILAGILFMLLGLFIGFLISPVCVPFTIYGFLKD